MTISRDCLYRTVPVLLLLAALLAGCASPGGHDETFSFAVLTDVQYKDQDPRGSRHYRASPAKLTVCVDDLNARDLAFAIHLGDFIDGDFASYDVVAPIYDRIKAPHHHVLGNHDFSVNDEDKGRVMGVLGLERPYYDFAHGSWRFVVLDGNDLSLRNPEKGEKVETAKAVLASMKEKGLSNAYPWNGGVGAEQKAWLEDVLASAARAGERAVVFCHFPVHPHDEHNLWNDGEIVAILEKHPCTAAYICGHNHAGGYAEKAGIHYLTLQGMVETPDTTSYAVIEVRDDALHVHGVGREPSRVLALRPARAEGRSVP
jgi:predicted phosphodiesterase